MDQSPLQRSSRSASIRALPLLAAGLLAGLVIVLGEAVLNVGLLAGDWDALMTQLGLPRPGPATVAQGLTKLMILGVFSVWLALALARGGSNRQRAAVLAGLVVWFLVWFWVQWGLLLAGYVTPTIAAATVAWGLVELPLAVAAGMWTYGLLEVRGTRPGRHA